MSGADDDYISELLKHGDTKKIPVYMQHLRQAITTFEQQTKLNASDFIGFGKRGTTQIKYFFNSDFKQVLIGELDKDD